MDNNMLYIIAGLVIVLLVVVLVLRKNKAQKQPTQPMTRANKAVTENTSAAVPKKGRSSSNQKDTAQTVTKFDHLTVAQRFIDQQRYDKAIESVERGLIETPHDSQLLLKLLNIYSITSQYDNFDYTYNIIKMHGDTSTIDEAEQLKLLLDQEQAPADVAVFEPIDQTSFEGIDFDLPKTRIVSDETLIDELETKDDSNMLQQNDITGDFGTDNNFVLTLDDLETAHSEVDSVKSTNTIETTGSNYIGNDFDDNRDRLTNDDISAELTIEESFGNVQNIDDEFSLDFDSISDVDFSSTPVITDAFKEESTFDNSVNELDLNDDDFVLDFDELTADASDIDNLSSTEQQPTNQDNFADFTLSLDNEDSIDNSTASTPTSDNNVSENVLGANVEDTLSQLDNLSFDDISFDNNTTDVVDNEIKSTEAPVFISNNELPDSQTFDDNTPIDDDFDFDSFNDALTAITPVEEEGVSLDFQNTDVTPTTDFAAQFAADFDFVKTLDNNQVTLDLAAQYLQLGEYDSAKRLLNEVIVQGDSEQQKQAQSLLARTA